MEGVEEQQSVLIMVKLEKIAKARESFMIEMGLHISRAKHTIEIPYQYRQMGARRCQCWPDVGI